MAMLKKVYRLAALMALLNVLAVGGLVSVLAMQGKLSRERVEAVAKALREGPAPVEAAGEAPVVEEGKSAPTTQPAAPEASREALSRRNFERLKAEAAHRLVLANRTMVDLTRQREQFQREMEEQSRTNKQRAAAQGEATFQKDLELISQEAPKVAIEHLLLRPVDDAARLLMAMDVRKGKKMIETANKDPRNWARFTPVLQKLRELAPDSEVLPAAGAAAGAAAGGE